MKVFNNIIAIIFLFFALVQYNDPDPILWILLYGFASLVLFLNAFGTLPRILIYAGLLAYATGLMILMPDFINWIKSGAPGITGAMQAGKPEIELVREFLGLVLCLAAMLSLLYFRKKPGKK